MTPAHSPVHPETVVDPKLLKHRPSRALADLDIGKLHPGMSPNVFGMLKRVIQTKVHPRVIEFGIGVSTYHLVDCLRGTEATYIGIEHNRSWFDIVEHWVSRLLTRHAKTLPLAQSRQVGPRQPKFFSRPLLSIDSRFTAGDLTVQLLLRQNVGLTGDGTEQEFYEYVQAGSGLADVVIVDGRARVPVLNHIHQTHILAPEGILFVHDAAGYQEHLKDVFPDGTFLEGRGGLKNPLRPDQRAVPCVPHEAYVWPGCQDQGIPDA